MAKEALKRKTAEKQGGQCNLTKVKLPKETKLYDTHRPKAKRHGGDYTKENTTVVVPIAHMKEHGNYRERSNELEVLKMTIDDREQVRKLLNKVNNQIDADKRRTDKLSKDAMEFLAKVREDVKGKLKNIDKEVEKQIKAMDDPLVTAALNVKGIGKITVAYCLVYIDVEEADHAPSLWAYAGLHCASHDRYKKGEASGGNKNLRTVLYTMADSQMKASGSIKEEKILQVISQETVNYLLENNVITKIEKVKNKQKYYVIKFNDHISNDDNLLSILNKIKCQDKKLILSVWQDLSIGAYRYVYYNIKRRLEKSDNKVLSRNTQGKLIECAWKDTKPSHRHGTGLRQIMKYFLADWWYVARSLKGLPVGPLYPESHLGKNHRTSYPQDRGWEYKTNGRKI